MRKPGTALHLLVLMGMAGCVSDATVRPALQDLPGRYYSGDGLGRLVYVTLEPNGAFTGNWEGCLGVYGQAEGTWRLEGDQVVFEHQSASGDLAGYLSRATTVRHSGKLALARSEDVVKEHIDEALVFLKQDE